MRSTDGLGRRWPGCIVEMKRMMKRTTEFNQALSMLYQFIEGDAQGQIIRITDTRCSFSHRDAVVFGHGNKVCRRGTTSRTCMNERASHDCPARFVRRQATSI